MNVFAKFDEILSIILQDIKETKRYGHTVGRSVGRSDGQRENSIPPTNIVPRQIAQLNSLTSRRHHKTCDDIILNFV